MPPVNSTSTCAINRSRSCPGSGSSPAIGSGRRTASISLRRDVASTREQLASAVSDESAVELGRQFVAHDTSPSNQAMRQELRDAVMEAVTSLPDAIARCF